MPFFRRKTDKQKTSPKRTARPPSTVSSGSNDSAAQNLNGNFVPLDDVTAPVGGRRPQTLLLRPDSVLDGTNGEQGGVSSQLKPQTPMGTSSRLSKTLQEVLHDKDALAYFIQYMASRDAEHIIKFWLDAGSFQASSWTRIRSHSLNKVTAAAKRVTSPVEEGSRIAQEESSSVSSSVSGGAASLSSPVNGDQADGDAATCESGSSAGGSSTALQRTGTAEANLHLMAHSAAASPTSPTQPGNCPLSPHDGPCPKDVTEGDPARFAEAGAHGTDPLSRGSLQALREDGASSSRDSGLGSSSPYLETAIASAASAVTAPAASNTTAGLANTGSDSVHNDDSQNCPTGQTSNYMPPVDSNTAQEAAAAASTATTTTNECPKLDTTKETSLQEKLRKSIEKDAVSIYSKYISLDATHPIGITEELRNEAISKICREDGQVDPHCFTACQEFVVRLMDKEYFQGFLQSDFHCKHQIDILTGSRVQLADVLYNEAALFYFMEFMEQEGAIDLLQCWLAIDNFQQQLSSQHGRYDAMEAQNDAMVIYEKYFSLQATNPLGFDDSVRFEVECNICREGGPLPDCFVTAKRQVLRTIDKVYFPQFLTSDLYFKFLNELINTVHSAGELGMRRRRAGSDASSEHSVGSRSAEEPSSTGGGAAGGGGAAAGSGGLGSTKNTLLAMDTSSLNIKKALTRINDDMRIDNTLFNPENLWQRPQAGMSLGRINEVGQFISEFAPNPDTEKKKKVGSSASFFKKRKDEKTQEEMALQIAQMIIKDVNMATANQDDTGLDMPS